MVNEKSFVFNGNEYDTKLFLQAQTTFTKVKLAAPPVFIDKRPSLVSNLVTTPVVTQYHGQMVVVACSEQYLEEQVNSKSFYYLATKHKLKSYILVNGGEVPSSNWGRPQHNYGYSQRNRSNRHYSN